MGGTACVCLCLRKTQQIKKHLMSHLVPDVRAEAAVCSVKQLWFASSARCTYKSVCTRSVNDRSRCWPGNLCPCKQLLNPKPCGDLSAHIFSFPWFASQTNPCPFHSVSFMNKSRLIFQISMHTVGYFRLCSQVPYAMIKFNCMAFYRNTLHWKHSERQSLEVICVPFGCSWRALHI